MNVKEITHEELATLVRDGRDIVRAIDVQHLNQNRPTSHPFGAKPKVKQTEEEERLRGVDIMRAYQLWYSKALAIVHHFLPWRVDDFKSLYEFPVKNRHELTPLNYRVADVLRGFGLRESDLWKRCYWLITAQCDILESAQAFIAPSQAYVQPMPQSGMPEIGDQELVVPVGETASAPSRKRKRKMDDDEKRRKESVAAFLNKAKKIGDRLRHSDKDEKVIDKEATELLQDAVRLG